MSAQEVVRHLRASPFRPLRIKMVSGQTVEVRHPGMVKVGTRDLIIFKFVSDNPQVYDDWDSFSLVLIESISQLEGSERNTGLLPSRAAGIQIRGQLQ